MPFPALPLLRALFAWFAFVAGLAAQAAPPAAGTAPQPAWLRHGQQLLEAEDPVGAWNAFRSGLRAGDDRIDVQVGLGRAHLMLGQSRYA
ncbi:MAG: hypothetical protein ACK501_08955, partial [Planctomycetota bacterium]